MPSQKVGRDRATKTTLTLVRHVDRYRAIQELHDEKDIPSQHYAYVLMWLDLLITNG